MSSAAPLAAPGTRRPGLTFQGYVVREAMFPTLVGLIGLTVVVLTASLLELSDLVINRGVSGRVVGQILFYQGVPVLTRMLPFALLVGILVTLGRLAADREILALEASGVSKLRLVWPVLLMSGVLSCVALLMSLEATPWAGRRLDATLDEVARAKPWAQLEAGKSSDFADWSLMAGEVSPAGDELEGVQLWVPDLGETVFARSGELATSGDGAILITLLHGRVVFGPSEGNGQTGQIHFDQATTLLPEDSSGLERKNKDRLKDLPLDELMDRAANWQALGAEYPRAAIEFHRRFAYPAAALAFGLLAVALFVSRRGLSRSSGGTIGLLCTIAYYGLMEFGEGLVAGRNAGPALGAWLPNLVMLGVASGLILLGLRRRRLPQDRDVRAGPRKERRPRESAWRSRPHHYALPRYVGGRAIRLLALSFVILFVAYFLIDLMDRVSWFSKYHATGGEVVRFYAARIWLLASRAVPMGILVGTALTVSLLAAEGELLGMRACGIPAPRALLPALIIAALLAPAYFMLNNVVLPWTNALADELKETEIKAEYYAAKRERRKAGYRSRTGNQMLEARRFDPDLGQARGITIFELGEDGLPVSRTDAVQGRHIGQGWWRLTEPVRANLEPERIEIVSAPRHAQLGDTVDAGVDTDHLSARELVLEAEAVESDGFDATPFRVEFHKRLAEPFACLVLPALVLFFAAGGPPFPTPAQTILVSAVIGVGYVLLVAVASSLGVGGALSPIVSAWAPIGFFSAVALGTAFHLFRRL